MRSLQQTPIMQLYHATGRNRLPATTIHTHPLSLLNAISQESALQKKGCSCQNNAAESVQTSRKHPPLWLLHSSDNSTPSPTKAKTLGSKVYVFMCFIASFLHWILILLPKHCIPHSHAVIECPVLMDLWCHSSVSSFNVPLFSYSQ